MDFSHALVWLRNDVWMRRQGWPKYQRIGMCRPPDQDPYIVIKVPFENDKHMFKTIPWVVELTCGDLLAEDWEKCDD